MSDEMIVDINELANARSSAQGEVNVRFLGLDDDRNYIVELDVLRSGWNDNHWNFQNIEKYAKTFAGTPILIAYIANGQRIGDGHNHSVKRDPKTGAMYYSYVDGTAERPVGYISTDPNDIRTEKRGEEIWIIAKGIIWQFYNKELVDKLKRTGRMSVSSETDIAELRKVDEGEIYDAWRGLGVTLLGDGVAPAVPGANIHALAALENEFKELKLRAASFQKPNDNGQEPHKKTDKGVKKAMFENRALLEKFSSKFPDYKVLSVSDDETKVCLLSKNGMDAFTYAFAESDKGAVVAERIKSVSLAAIYSFGEGEKAEDIMVPVDCITKEMAAQIKSLTEQVGTLTTANGTLQTQLTKMAEDKKAHNTKAAKEAATNRLAEINANKSCEEDKIAADCLTALMESIDKGEFAECENPEEAARKAVNAAAMEKQSEIDKKKAEATRLAQQQRFAFEPGFFGGENGGGNEIQDAMSRIMK